MRLPCITLGYVGEPTVVVLEDALAVAEGAAERIAAAVGRAVRERGWAHIALTGGSSAVALYRTLAEPPWRDTIDWSRVHLWWGDERIVPLDHPESNANLAFATLLHIDAHIGQSGSGAVATDVDAGIAPGVRIPPEQVHPIPIAEALGGGGDGEEAAKRYAALLRTLLPVNQQGIPELDVVLLGLGADGHILSVFPDSPALRPDAPLVMAVPAPSHITPHLPRVTLNPRIVPAAHTVLVMVPGDAKAAILAEVLGGDRDVRRWPAEAARCENAVWLCDRAAAAQLPGDREAVAPA